MKILIDRNVQRSTITAKFVLEPQYSKWGKLEFTIRVAKSQSSKPRSDEVRRVEDVGCLADLCSHSKAGRIEFFVSHELHMEALRQKPDTGGYCGTDLLDGVPIKIVRCPVERSILISGSGESTGIIEAEQMNFFKSIRHQRFQQIVDATGPSRIDDAFHLWTAEEEKIDAFLTMDYKFWDAVNRNRDKLATSVKVLRPSDWRRF